MNALKGKFDRLGQTLNEKFGGGEKTELEPELQKQVTRLHEASKLSDTILEDIKAYAQPDPMVRVLPKMCSADKKSKPEVLSVDMKQLSDKLGSDDVYAKALKATSESFHKMGQAERDFLTAVDQKYVQAVKLVKDGEFAALESSLKTLEEKRLNLDAYRGKLKGKEISEEDEHLKQLSEAYSAQVEKVKESAVAAEAKLPDLKAALKAFVEAEIEWTEKKKQCLDELSKNI